MLEDIKFGTRLDEGEPSAVERQHFDTMEKAFSNKEPTTTQSTTTIIIIITITTSAISC